MEKKKKGVKSTSEQFLRNVELPEQTESYTVISHGDIIDKVRELLKKNNFEITDEKYFYTVGGKIAHSKVYIKSEKDPDMGMLFTWQNSYNKQVKFSCAVGSFIYDNMASWIGTEGFSWIRKHTGTADEESVNIMTQLIDAAEDYFDKIIIEKEKMKAMPLSVEDYGCIMGSLYFENELITPTQASAVINERKKPTNEYSDKDTLWGLYKIIMFGMEGMDIKKWMKCQQKVHHTIMNEYLIIQDEKETSEEVIKLDPKEDIKNEEPILKKAMFSSEEAFINQMAKELNVDKAIVEYYSESHYDKEKSAEENIKGLKKYIGEENLKVNDVAETNEDEVTADQTEELELKTENFSEEKIEVIKKENGYADETESLFSDETIEEEVDEELELEKALSIDEETSEVLENINENVDIVEPKEELEGLEIPEELKEQVKVAEKRMKELYGEVTEYEINDNCVLLKETGEVFYI